MLRRAIITVAMFVFLYPAPAAAQAADLDAVADFLTHDPDPQWDPTQPRGKHRQVDFTTDEGTWMSVDISPDGLWVVFDMLGHIYRVPATGGAAQSLTQGSGVALNYHPRFSPDGRSIAFISDRKGQANLWLMDADGSNPRPLFLDPVTRMTSPAWLPGGSAVVAVREFPTYSMHRRSARIWRFPVHSKTEPPVELVGAASGRQYYWPSPSPDGRYIYFMTSTFAEPLHGLQRNQHIRRLDLATGAIAIITRPTAEREYRLGTNNELAPEISPDGRWLAYAKRIPGGFVSRDGHVFNERNALWLRDLATGAERILMDPITLDMQGAHGMKNLRILPGYAWAKDSQSLVIWHDGKIRRVDLNGKQNIIPFSARVQRTASEQIRARGGIEDRVFTSQSLRWPNVSLPLDKVIFEAVGEIWWAPLGKGRVKAEPLVAWTDDMAYYMPDLGPGGTELVFIGWNDFGLGSVYRCRLPDCRPQKISGQKAVYLYPVLSHDERAVYVFRSQMSDPARVAAGDAGAYDLVRITGQEETVIQSGIAPLPLSRGPDGRLFLTTREGDTDIQKKLMLGQSIAAQRTTLSSFDPAAPFALRRHLLLPNAQWVAPSPNGGRVAYAEDFEIHVGPFYRPDAKYAKGEAHHWVGNEIPQALIKENPRHHVVSISQGGGIHPRWVDGRRVVYAAGGRIHVYDVETQKTETMLVEAKVAKPTPDVVDSIAFTNARIIPISGDRVIDRGAVVVRGGRIACVGECDVTSVSRSLDMTGKTIMPGMVDVHAHGGFRDRDLFPQHLSPQALYLAHGVTSTLDPSVPSDHVFPVAELIEAGRISGPRSFATGEALLPTSPSTGPADAKAAARLVDRLAGYGARSIKVFLTPRRDQRQMLSERARALGLSVTNEGADLYYNVGSILDGHTGFEHPMHYLTLYKDAQEFFGQLRAVYSPTLIVAGPGRWAEEYHKSRSDLWRDPVMRRFMPWQDLALHRETGRHDPAEYGFPFLAEGVKGIRARGGYGAIGGHGELWGRDSHWDMWTYASAATPLEVLTMATRDGAYMLGLETEIGSLEKGKVADMIILDANPLDDIRNSIRISYVMKGGVLYDAKSLDTIWPVEKSYGTPPWYEDEVLNRPE